MTNRRLFCAAISILASLLGMSNALAAPNIGIQLPEKLRHSIATTFPGFRVVTKKDIDWSDPDCGKPTNRDKTAIQADFNGDGLDDFAVLLFGSKKEAKKNWWQFGDSKSSKLKLVVFLAAKSGTFNKYELDEMDQSIPIWHVMSIIEPGAVFAVDSPSPDGKIFLKHPGIALIRCGGGAGAFYWEGNQFRTANIGD
jgi:hypothetical protein